MRCPSVLVLLDGAGAVNGTQAYIVPGGEVGP